jgi:putative ABC transport system ATP-binding protein
MAEEIKTEDKDQAAAEEKRDYRILLATHIVRAVGVRKTYEMGGQPLHALKGVDFKVRRGEYMSIMGPSGSGKSTLFNMIGGLDKPNEGRVFIDEVDIAALNTFELAWLRCHKIGYIFQTFNLIPVSSALDNVMMPMLFAGTPQADAQDKAAALLEKVGLGQRIFHKPVQMSGGQQQRVAIARSLANSPSILLADEPTGNLDAKTGEDIIHLLKTLNESEGVTVISATHDHKMLAVSDRIAWIRDGRVERVEERGNINIQAGSAGSAVMVPGQEGSELPPVAAKPESDPNVIASARGVKRRYMMGEEEVWALGGVDLDVYRGEYLSIMGPSGSGKSTLFNMIGGLDTPTEGQIFIEGANISKLNPQQVAWLRSGKIGFIFQTFNLIDVMTALENVMLPMTFANLPDEEAREKARRLLEKVGLGERYDHRPSELSGGQQQRVAVARALANDPSILLADEPTGNLDLKTGEAIIEMLQRLKDDLGVTIITATHDHKMLAASDRVIYLVDGKIVNIRRREDMNITFGVIEDGAPTPH